MNTKPSPRYVMKIRELKLASRLGCEPEERAQPQEVRINVDLRFREAPLGTLNDQLGDTVCYAEISAALKTHVESREFCLIEKMAHDLYGIVSSIVENRAEVAVTVHKVKPPVPGLDGGVEFRMGDFD